jgi:hypothetical protein
LLKDIQEKLFVLGSWGHTKGTNHDSIPFAFLLCLLCELEESFSQNNSTGTSMMEVGVPIQSWKKKERQWHPELADVLPCESSGCFSLI